MREGGRVRILGVDPGLTRCGIGVVDVAPDRSARLVHVGVIQTPAGDSLERRLLAIAEGLDTVLDDHGPDAVAVERVFAQSNLSTVMGTAQVSGIALLAAARRGLSVGLHTPSEVKAAVTGHGGAQKAQVTAMVVRILRLTVAPKPADAADALAIAICHGWRSPVVPIHSLEDTGAGGTAAQKAWLAAERAARASAARPRLSR